MEQCMSFCALFPRGAATSANTLECRVARIAQVAADPTNCRPAGPFGLSNDDGTNDCAPIPMGEMSADPCENFCALARAACPSSLREDQTTCVESECQPLASQRRQLDIANRMPSSGDDLECRQQQLAAALDPAQGGAARCGGLVISQGMNATCAGMVGDGSDTQPPPVQPQQ
jgi:hypothetical protein